MTRYDLIRRRLAPIAFGVAIVLMARESCSKQQRTHATFVLDLGAAASTAHAVDAEIWMNGEQVSVFHRVALDGLHLGKTQFSGSYPATDGELRIDVELAPGDHRKITRKIHLDEGATVTVALDHELR